MSPTLLLLLGCAVVPPADTGTAPVDVPTEDSGDDVVAVSSPEDCDDGSDNDLDGLLDCEDGDCADVCDGVFVYVSGGFVEVDGFRWSAGFNGGTSHRLHGWGIEGHAIRRSGSAEERCDWTVDRVSAGWWDDPSWEKGAPAVRSGFAMGGSCSWFDAASLPPYLEITRGPTRAVPADIGRYRDERYHPAYGAYTATYPLYFHGDSEAVPGWYWGAATYVEYSRSVGYYTNTWRWKSDIVLNPGSPYLP